VKRLIAEHGIDAVIHFAGFDRVPESIEKPLLYYANNTQVRCARHACVEMGVKHSSSPRRRGLRMAMGIEIREDTPTDPINPYGRSKLLTEWILRDAAAAHDFRFVALALFQRRRRPIEGTTGQSTPRATHLIKPAFAGSAWPRAAPRYFRHRLRHARRHGDPRLHPVSDLVAIHRSHSSILRGGGGPEIFNCGYGHGPAAQVVGAMERITAGSFQRSCSRAAPRFRPPLSPMSTSSGSVLPGSRANSRLTVSCARPRLENGFRTEPPHAGRAQSGVDFAIEKLPPCHAWKVSGAASKRGRSHKLGLDRSWLQLYRKNSIRSSSVPHARKAGALAIGCSGAPQRHGIVRTHQLHFNATGEPAFDTITIEHKISSEKRLCCRLSSNGSRIWCCRRAESCPAFHPIARRVSQDCCDQCGICRRLRTMRFRLSRATECGHAQPQRAPAAESKPRDLSRFGPLRVEEASDPRPNLNGSRRSRSCTFAPGRAGAGVTRSDPISRPFTARLVCSDAVQLLRIRAASAGSVISTIFVRWHGVRLSERLCGRRRRDRPGYVSMHSQSKWCDSKALPNTISWPETIA